MGGLELVGLVDEARQYAAASRAGATIRAYATDWAHFETFCRRHDLLALPAEPATVALYLTELAHDRRPSTITRRTAAISVQHQRHGLDSPTRDPRVREIVRGIRRTIGVATRQAAPARIGEIRRMVAHLPDSRIGRRDRALLLVGFATAMRASELVAITVADIERREEGVVITKRRSKTDQEGAGARLALPLGSDPQTCPVAALDAWVTDAGIVEGPVLRAVSRHGSIGKAAMTEKGVTLAVKRAAQRAGLDPSGYSAHSLRSGFVTTAAANGASERSIAAQTGHRSMEVLRGYVRHATVFTDNAATNLGL